MWKIYVLLAVFGFGLCLMVYRQPHILMPLLPQWLLYKKPIHRFITKRMGFPQAFASLIEWSQSPQARAERAREALEELRKGNYDQSGVDYDLGPIIKALETGVSYKRIGTTKEQIIAFRSGKKSQKIYAEKKLQALRDGKDCSARLLRELLEKEKIAPEEIRSSWEEIYPYEREEKKSYLQYLLKEFRRVASGEILDHKGGIKGVAHYLPCLQEQFEEGSRFAFTPEELGTTSDELQTLNHKVHLLAAEATLDWLRRGRFIPAPGVKRLQNHLRSAGIGVGTIGSSDAEIADILQNGRPYRPR